MPYTFQRPNPTLQTVTSEPPDKRRRTADTGQPGTSYQVPARTSQELPVPTVTDDDWGALEDDFGLTVDQLEELDMMASQAIACPPKPVETKTQSNFSKHFTTLNRTANVKTQVKSKVQSNVPFYNSNTDTDNGTPRASRNNIAKVDDSMSADTMSKSMMVATGHKTTTDPGIMDAEIKRIAAENEQYQSQISKMRELDNVRDGEIKILRQSLKQKEHEIVKQKLNQSDVVDQQAKDHLQRQKELERQVDQLQTQIRFKDQEIHEFSTSVKRLEQRQLADSAHNQSVPANQISPKLNKRVPHSPRTPKTENGFPTTESFIGKRPSPLKMKVSTPVQTDPVPMATTAIDIKRETKRVVNLPKRCKLKSKTNPGFMTGPLLVNKLQNETETGVYKFVEMCQNLPKSEPSDLERCHIAEAGLAGLLSKTGARMLSKPSHGDTANAVDILPLIAHVLDEYLSTRKNEKTVKIGLKSETQSSHLVTCLISSLDICHCLVSYSPDVRAAMLNHVTEADRVSPVAGPSGDDGSRPKSSCLQSAANTHLLDQLTTLLSLSNTQMAAVTTILIIEKCLLIFDRLASQATGPQLESFLPLVQSGVLSDVLTSSRERPDLLELAVRLVRSLAQSNKLLTTMCKLSDQCTFYCLYTALQSASTSSSGSDRCVEDLVALVSTIVSRHKGGATFLQESDCVCNYELPKTLSLLLHGLVRSDDVGGNPRAVRTLRKGLMLVYTLSVRGMSPEHFAEVDTQYTGFVNEMKRLISTLPDASDNEEIAVRYLWDFDDDSGHEENSTNMDWDQEES